MQDQNLHEEVWRVVRTVAQTKLSEPQRQLLHEFWVAFVIPFFDVTSIAIDDLLATLTVIVPNAPKPAAPEASSAPVPPPPPPPPPAAPSKNDKKKGSSKKDKAASSVAANKDQHDMDAGTDKDRRQGDESDSDGEGEVKARRPGEGASNSSSAVTPNLAAAFLTLARLSKHSDVLPKLKSIHATQLSDIHALAAAAAEAFGVSAPVAECGAATASTALALSSLTGAAAMDSASAVTPSPTAGTAALAMTSMMGIQVKPTRFALDMWRSDEFNGSPISHRIAAAGSTAPSPPASMRVFMAAPNFFVFFKLYQVLYERLQVAHGLAVRGRSGGVLLHDTSDSTDATYARFSRLLFDLLSGALDNARFEDECRQTLGAGSFALFTVDKVALQLIKHVQSALLSDTGAAFLSLYARERIAVLEVGASLSERDALRVDKHYELAAARLLLEENNRSLVRIQFCKDSKELSMGLVDTTLYIDPKAPAEWAALVTQLASHPTVAGPAGAALLKAATPMNEFLKKSFLLAGAKPTAVSQAIVQRNELQTQLCMQTYKMSFVAGTEDVFVRTAAVSNADAVAQCQRDRQRSQELVSTWLAGQLAAGKAEDDARLLFKDEEDEEDDEEGVGADGDEEEDDDEDDEEEEEQDEATPDQLMAMLTGATAVQDEDDDHDQNEDDDPGDDDAGRDAGVDDDMEN
jgi:hypothetical protein